MKREFFLVSVLIVGFVSMAMAAPQKPKQNMRRVAEIAAMLPDEPGFPEARLGNRKMWDSLAKLPDANKAIKEGLRILSEPIPVLDDNIYTNTVREIWGPLSDKRMHNLVKLTLAECLENKGRFLPLACGYLDAIASQTTWMNPYHDRVCFGNFYGKYRSIDLNGSDAALCVAIALDTLKEKVPEETKRRAMAAMRKFMVEPYLKDAAGKGFKHSWFFGDNNWNPTCHNQCVGAALRVVEDKIERAKFIEGAERGVPFFLGGFSKEGYCQEGLSYWNYGFTEYLRLGHIVRVATSGKVDLFAYEQAKKCYLYAYGFQLAENASPQFGDGTSSTPMKINLFLGELVWPELKCSFSAGLSPLSGRIEHVPVLGGIPMSEFDSRASLPPFNYPIRTFFEDAQVLICRPEKSGKDTISVCIKGGHNGVPHNHNDAGQYRDEITLDLRGVYDSMNILKLERCMVFDRANGVVTVSDDVLFAKPGTYESPISTFGEIVKNSRAGSFAIVRKAEGVEKRLEFMVDANGAKWTAKEEKIPNPTRTELTRWAVVIDKPSVRHKVKFVFRGGGIPAPFLSVSGSRLAISGGPRVSRRRLGARSLPMFFSSARPSPTSATSFRFPAERNRGRSNFPIFAFSSSRENW